MLSGRVALVTGGGSGIGRAVCAALAIEGAKVVIADVNKEMGIITRHALPNEREHQVLEVNVGRGDSVARLFSAIRKQYSSVPSIVVNCAGIAKESYLLNTDEQDFDEVLRINLKGTFLVTKTAALEMKSEKVENGSIINLSSMIAKTGRPEMCHYSAAKAAVIGFTKAVAQELAPLGVRCNVILPGIIDTPMLVQVSEEQLEQVFKSIPLQRKGTAEDIASVCLFLASPRSSYVTGAVVEVSGGQAM